MLILTRRIGEALIVGDAVNITVLGIKGNQVRLDINAPKSISVHREEIYLKIKEEEKEQRIWLINHKHCTENTNQTVN